MCVFAASRRRDPSIVCSAQARARSCASAVPLTKCQRVLLLQASLSRNSDDVVLGRGSGMVGWSKARQDDSRGRRGLNEDYVQGTRALCTEWKRSEVCGEVSLAVGANDSGRESSTSTGQKVHRGRLRLERQPGSRDASVTDSRGARPPPLRAEFLEGKISCPPPRCLSSARGRVAGGGGKAARFSLAVICRVRI